MNTVPIITKVKNRADKQFKDKPCIEKIYRSTMKLLLRSYKTATEQGRTIPLTPTYGFSNSERDTILVLKDIGFVSSEAVDETMNPCYDPAVYPFTLEGDRFYFYIKTFWQQNWFGLIVAIISAGASVLSALVK